MQEIMGTKLYTVKVHVVLPCVKWRHLLYLWHTHFKQHQGHKQVTKCNNSLQLTKQTIVWYNPHLTTSFDSPGITWLVDLTDVGSRSSSASLPRLLSATSSTAALLACCSTCVIGGSLLTSTCRFNDDWIRSSSFCKEEDHGFITLGWAATTVYSAWFSKCKGLWFHKETFTRQ